MNFLEKSSIKNELLCIIKGVVVLHLRSLGTVIWRTDVRKLTVTVLLPALERHRNGIGHGIGTANCIELIIAIMINSTNLREHTLLRSRNGTRIIRIHCALLVSSAQGTTDGESHG